MPINHLRNNGLKTINPEGVSASIISIKCFLHFKDAHQYQQHKSQRNRKRFYAEVEKEFVDFFKVYEKLESSFDNIEIAQEDNCTVDDQTIFQQ